MRGLFRDDIFECEGWQLVETIKYISNCMNSANLEQLTQNCGLRDHFFDEEANLTGKLLTAFKFSSFQAGIRGFVKDVRT